MGHVGFTEFPSVFLCSLLFFLFFFVQQHTSSNGANEERSGDHDVTIAHAYAADQKSQQHGEHYPKSLQSKEKMVFNLYIFLTNSCAFVL